MKKILFYLLLILVLKQVSIAQPSSQVGGFTYGWSSYTNDEDTGLGPRAITFDYTGVNTIMHAPSIGIHPRVYFGPDEIPDIQNRLLNTESGKWVSRQIHAYTTLMHRGWNIPGGYERYGTYALDCDNNRLITNEGFWNNEPYYTKLVAEDASVFSDASFDQKRRSLLGSIMALEAFECLMYQGQFDPDTGQNYDDRAADLATALTFWANYALTDPTVSPYGNNFRNFPATHMALTYDMNYNAMTTAQQNIVRQAIVKVIPDNPRYGDNLNCYANTSNWSTLNNFEILPNLAIEGEVGYKPNLTRDWMRSLYNFITYGWYPSGAGYEGLGKNYMMAVNLVAAAKRGYSLLGHPHVRAYATEFLPAITQPFGYGFTSYDVWGGSGYNPEKGKYKFNSADAIGLKWIFPNDQAVDFVWRNYIRQADGFSSDGYIYQQFRPDDSYLNYMVPAAVFALDYDDVDFNTRAATAIPTDYFAADRGLAIMRTGTDSLDMVSQFHCRQDMGGHTHGDRNDFTLSGLGRIWVRKTYGGSPFQPMYFHSGILVDGLGTSISTLDGDKCRLPGKVLDYQSSNAITCVSGDATYAYTYDWYWTALPANTEHPFIAGGFWTAVTETWNDFQYIPQTEPQYHIPFYDFPHWSVPNRLERMVKREYNPMQRVVRTVGMVKGNHPFMLVVDDIQKDTDSHTYEWAAQVANDLVIESTDINLDNCNYRNDIILKEPDATGNRRLLVRILNNEGYAGTSANGALEPLEYYDFFSGNAYNPNPNFSRQRLVVESNSIAPDFRVLLYPHYDGDELPITTWNSTRDIVTVIFSDEEQRIRLAPQEAGRWNKIELLAPSTSTCVCAMDADGDGVCDVDDICPNGDDTIDTDLDLIPDACDICPNSTFNQDVDNDGVCDDIDVCLSGDDAIDTDADLIPDACDPCPNSALNDANTNNICDQIECTLVEESFDYASGSVITDAAGGSGLVGNWGTNTHDGTVSLESSSLTYTGLPSQGNKLRLQANSNQVLLSRSLAGNSLSAGKTIWLSFLLKANAIGAGHFFVKPAQSQALAIGKSWGANLSIDNNSTSTTMVVGQTYWVVARYDLGSTTDAVYLWINPDPNIEPAISTADATKTATSILPINNIELDLQHYGQGDFEVDELRISCEYPVMSSTRNLNVKTLLQGAYDTGSLMNHDLAGLLPTIEPYTSLGYNHVGTGGNEQMTANAIGNTGNEAIVDWVVLELRDMNDATNIIGTRSALLQADGDIVDTDGQSPVAFQVPAGMYYIAVRHRNHLGIMTATPINLE